MTIDPAAVAAKIQAAKSDLAGAAQALDEAMGDLHARGRAEKQIIGAKLEAAFSRMHVARRTLAELERDIALDDPSSP